MTKTTATPPPRGDLPRLARGGLLSVGGDVTGAAGTMLLAILLTNGLGVDESGSVFRAIAAFNIGNAFGAWIGGVTLAAGLGYTSPLWAGAAVTVGGLIVLLVAVFAPGGEFARRAPSRTPRHEALEVSLPTGSISIATD